MPSTCTAHLAWSSSNPSVIEILSKNQGYSMVRKDLREYKIKDTFNNFPYDSFFSDEDLQTEKT